MVLLGDMPGNDKGVLTLNPVLTPLIYISLLGLEGPEGRKAVKSMDSRASLPGFKS